MQEMPISMSQTYRSARSARRRALRSETRAAPVEQSSAEEKQS